MPNTPTDWNPGIVAAVIGLVFGALAVFFARRRRVPSPGSVLDQSLTLDLEARRDALYAQIEELDRSPGPRSSEDGAAERTRLEVEAARTLKAIDESRNPRAVPASPATSANPPRPVSAVTGFVWGVLSMAMVGGLVYFVSQRATPREQGSGMTGSIGPPGGAPAVAEPAEIKALRAAVDREPRNVDTRLALVRGLLTHRDLVGVFEQTEAILQISPGQPEAMSYQAVVRITMGQADVARDMLQQVIKADPGFVDAYLHLALAQVRLGRNDEAKATIDTAAAKFPAQADLFARAYAQMQQAERADPAAEAENPHPPIGGPAGAAVTPSEASGRASLAGTIDIDPSLRGVVGRGATVFIAVREAGIDKGPPVAVKRLSVDAFPIRFAITDADSMAGESLPPRVRIDVRADSDGNAATRDPNDPKAALDQVAVGQAGLRLLLKR
jgi:thioredoxin-like negative regulator of GroEL